MHSATEMKPYIIVKSFHLGEAVLNLTMGDQVMYDGATMTYKGKTVNAPSLARAIQARLLIPDNGTNTIKKAAAPAPKPAMKVLIEDQENMVVAQIRLPEHAAGMKIVRPNTETVAKTTAETATRRVVTEDQRVVGSAKPPPKQTRASLVSGDDGSLAEQNADATVVRTKVSNLAQELLRAEGVVLGSKGQEIISADSSEGVVVGKVKSLEQRKAELEQNSRAASVAIATASRDDMMTADEREAFNRDLELAKAKREGRAPVGAKAAPVERPKPQTIQKTAAAEPVKKGAIPDGFPEGYPYYNRVEVRIQWCKDNFEHVKLIYTLSNEKFRAQLKVDFPDVDFE